MIHQSTMNYCKVQKLVSNLFDLFNNLCSKQLETVPNQRGRAPMESVVSHAQRNSLIKSSKQVITMLYVTTMMKFTNTKTWFFLRYLVNKLYWKINTSKEANKWKENIFLNHLFGQLILQRLPILRLCWFFNLTLNMSNEICLDQLALRSFLVENEVMITGAWGQDRPSFSIPHPQFFYIKTHVMILIIPINLRIFWITSLEFGEAKNKTV